MIRPGNGDPARARAPPGAERRVRRPRHLGLDREQLLRGRRRLQVVREALRARRGRRGHEQGQSEHALQVTLDRCESPRSSSSRPSPAAPRRPAEPRPSSAAKVEPVRWADLRFTYRAGCPVGPAQLRTVEVSYWDFAGKPKVGRIVVARRVADDVVDVFRQLWAKRFPIRRLQPISAYRGDDDASMAADNTSGFNCRFVAGTNALVDARLRRGDRRQHGREPVRPRLDHLAAGRPGLPRPQPLPQGDGRPRRRAGARVRLGRLEVGRVLRRLPALLDHRPMSDPLRPFWDFDDLDATEARFRALRAEALTQLARVEGLRDRFEEGDRLLDEVVEQDARVRIRVDLERGRLRRSSGDKEAALPLFESAFTKARRSRGGLARGRCRAHVRAGGARPGRLHRVDDAWDRARGVLRRGRVLARPAVEQPRLGVLRRGGARAGARAVRACPRGAVARSGEPAAIEHAREAVAEALSALGRAG